MPSIMLAAVIGTGNLSRRITEQLLVCGAYVIVFASSRDSSSTPEEIPRGSIIVRLDYRDKRSLISSFTTYGVEIVVSCLHGEALDLQPGIGDAAKQAGVKLFIPNDFGFPLPGYTQSTSMVREGYAQYMTRIGLPTTRVLVGICAEGIPWLVASSSAPGKVSIIGSGNIQASFTSIIDIAGFIGHVLTSYSISQLANQVFRLEGQSVTLREIAAMYGKEAIQVDSLDDPDATYMQKQIDIGLGGCGNEAHNSRMSSEEADLIIASKAWWAGHVWRNVRDALPGF
ncbi:uncharacterized protein EV420DRAFT_1688864 [Desarmillaria tabescens]|uniref:NmrA-like domain-containing protein n=1 Tax=Armillaria tabescens TaxID=1929756 RepID=A0AA39KCU5_ARMTA|nr:uncharacterized protein EV420DRAFT_1688864 [Desarmillaria tabescens]KAK0457511.1 hypothetical protein EV420DRAFT_1688864 [Desarmillaria tabescens]